MIQAPKRRHVPHPQRWGFALVAASLCVLMVIRARTSKEFSVFLSKVFFLSSPPSSSSSVVIQRPFTFIEREESDGDEFELATGSNYPNWTHPQTESLVFYTSTVYATHLEMAAMRSWAACGAKTRILLFVDHLQATSTALAAFLEPELLARFTVLENPRRGKSPMSGKVRIDVLIEEAQKLTDSPVGDENHWFVLINSDVFVTPAHCYAANAKLARKSTMGLTGLRIDCPVTELYPHSRKGFTPDVVFASEIQKAFVADVGACNLHGPGAMDFFAHRKGFFEDVMASHNKTLKDLSFYMGVGKWDNSVLHLARRRLIDISPVGVLLHFLPTYNRNDTWRKWETTWTQIFSDEQVQREYPENKVPDNVHNARQACFIANRFPPARYCGLKASVYDVDYRACPSGAVVLQQHSDHQAYRDATGGNFMNTLPEEIKSGVWAGKLRCPEVETKRWGLFDDGVEDREALKRLYGDNLL